MKNIRVEIIEMSTPTPIIEAMKMPYGTEKIDMKLIKKICMGETRFSEKHGSVLEHINISWRITGSSRLELQEHMRHRHASPTVQSARFTLLKSLDFNGEVEDIEEYFVFPKGLSVGEYNMLRGFYEQSLLTMRYMHRKYGWDNDKLKYLLPEGFRTKFVWTTNMRQMLNFFRLRLESDAHFEIRHIAELMLDELERTWVGELL